MSECVVRMEMPKSCYNCDLRYECNAFYAPGKPKPFMKGCMIVCRLPEGHGPLVDADALKEHSVHFGETEYTFDFDAVFVEEIDEAPTIVPADTAERSET